MKVAHLSEPAEERVVFRDGLGVRTWHTDTHGDRVERCALGPEFAGVETPLRDRITRLQKFQHPKFVRVFGMDAATRGAGPVVVSAQVPGTRLVEILEMARHGLIAFEPGAALQVTREVLGALAVLHDSRNLAHGALAPERVLIAPTGRVMIAEYVLGHALERLNLPRHQLWRDYHIVTPPGSGTARFDLQIDLPQVGVLALAALLGRTLDEEEYPHRLRGLLPNVQDRLAQSPASRVAADVTAWLERLLPVESKRPFKSLRDAQHALEAIVSTQATAMGITQPRLKQVMTAMAALAEPVADASEPDAKPLADFAASTSDAAGTSGAADETFSGKVHGPQAADLAPEEAAATAANGSGDEAIDIEALLRLEAELEGGVSAPPARAAAPTTPVPASLAPANPVAEEPPADVVPEPAPSSEPPTRAELERQFADLIAAVAPSAVEPTPPVAEVPADTPLMESPRVRLLPEVPDTVEPLINERVQWSAMPVDPSVPDEAEHAASAADVEAGPLVAPSLLAGLEAQTEHAPAAALPSVPSDWWREALPWRNEAGTEDVNGEVVASDVPALEVESAPFLSLTPLSAGAAPLDADAFPAALPEVVEISSAAVPEFVTEAAPSTEVQAVPAPVVDEPASSLEVDPAGMAEEPTPTGWRGRLARTWRGAFGSEASQDEAPEARTHESQEVASATSDGEAAAPVFDAESAVLEPIVEASANDLPAVVTDAGARPTESESFSEHVDVVDVAPMAAVAEAVETWQVETHVATGDVPNGVASSGVDLLNGPLAVLSEVEAETQAISDVPGNVAAPLLDAQAFEAAAYDAGEPPHGASMEVASPPVEQPAEDPLGAPPIDPAASVNDSEGVGSGWFARLRSVVLSDGEPDVVRSLQAKDAPGDAATPHDALFTAQVREAAPGDTAPQSVSDDGERQIIESREDVASIQPAAGDASVSVSSEPETEVVDAVVPAPTSADAALARELEGPTPATVVVGTYPDLAPPVYSRAFVLNGPSNMSGEGTIEVVAAPDTSASASASVDVDRYVEAESSAPAPMAEAPLATEDASAAAGADSCGADTEAPVEQVETADEGTRVEQPAPVPGAIVAPPQQSASAGARAGKGERRRRKSRRRRTASTSAAAPVRVPPVEMADAPPPEALLSAPERVRSIVDRDVPAWTPPERPVVPRRPSPPPPTFEEPAAVVAAVAASSAPSTPTVTPRLPRAMPAPVEPASPFEQEIRAVGLPDFVHERPAVAVMDVVTPRASGDDSRRRDAEMWTAKVPVTATRGVNWRRVSAAVILLALFQGAAFAAWWFSKPGEVGTLVVQTRQEGVDVLVDGKMIGRTPFRGDLSPGRHTLALRQGTQVREMPVEISLGVVTTQSLDWPRPAGPALGNLQVTSTPTGAEVFVDGRSRGKTPLIVENLADGRHQLMLRSDSGTVSLTTSVIAGETTTVEVPIFAGWILVHSPVELTLRLNGQKIGTSSDGQILMSPGTHRVEVTSDALGFSETLVVTIEPGDVRRVTVRVPTVPLDVQGEPGTEVFVDGERVGTLPEPIHVPLGTHDVLVRRPDGRERRQTLTVRRGEPAELTGS